MKRCACCKKHKEKSEFYKRSNRKSGLSCYCKACVKVKYGGDYRKEYNVMFAMKQKEEYNNSQEIRNKKKNYELKSNFGITLEDYNRMFEEQEGCCAICRKHQSDIKRALAVDHDHETGEVRGLLCHKCNSTIGFANDDLEILSNAIGYLKKYK